MRMNDQQRAMITALSKCSFGAGSWDKRFVRDLAFKLRADPKADLSPRQEWALRQTYYRYRKQVGQPEMQKPKDYDTPPAIKVIERKNGDIIICAKLDVSRAMAEDLERLKDWNEGKAR